MKPAARVAAAIDILDRVLAGDPAERCLTNWARSNRYAGSGDRHAVRDLVFDAIRCRRSYAALGGALTGRGLMIGALRAAGTPVETVFDGEGYAPKPLSVAEATVPPPLGPLEALDCPDWVAPHLKADLGDDFGPTMALMQTRAPLFLRVNLRKGAVSQAIDQLAADGVTAERHALAETALKVTQGARKVQTSSSYKAGIVEIQDVASQAVCAAIPVPANATVLDYCAGGGGKTLALASRSDANFLAFDANPERMRDLPARAKRAGAKVRVLSAGGLDHQGPADLVIADVPCSGSGAWRRQAEAKWSLSESRLQELISVQREILRQVSGYVVSGGRIAYITCSIFTQENVRQIELFLHQNPDFILEMQQIFHPLQGGDGLYLAVLRFTS
ncbi:MAG: RsmB/NOP family class I SAM-dependent RNA methyltransferase [Pseudomonadota bacterium]